MLPFEHDRFFRRKWLLSIRKKNGITNWKHRYSVLWRNKWIPTHSFFNIFFFLVVHYICVLFFLFLVVEMLFKFYIYIVFIWNVVFCFSDLVVFSSITFLKINQKVYLSVLLALFIRDIVILLYEHVLFFQWHPVIYWRMYINEWWINKHMNLVAVMQVLNIPRWTWYFICLSLVLDMHTSFTNLIITNIYSNLTFVSSSMSLFTMSFLNLNFFSTLNISNIFFENNLSDLYSSFYFWCPELILFLIIILNLFMPYIKINWYKEMKYLLFLKCSLVLITFLSFIYFLDFTNYFFSNEFFYLNSISFFFQFFILFIVTIYTYNLNLSYYFKQNTNGKYYKKEKFYFYEFYSLIFASTLISILAIKSNNLFFLWFNMEILSILAYFMSSFGNSDRRLVSSFVYFIFNSLAGGIILFGSTILLKNFSSDHTLISENFQNFFFLNNFEYKLGIFLIFIGFLIKLGLFPFHFWNIKTYGEVTPRIFFFFVLVYKITLFFLFYRLITSFFINSFSEINYLLIVCCCVSALVGGIGACYEISLQKFLTYTSLVQSAYILGGFLSNSIESITSALLYSICYFIVFLGFYLSFTLLSNKNLFFSDLPILYYSNPFVGILFIFYIFLLIGIPPSILFFSKFLLFLNIFFTGNYFMFFIFLFVSIFTAIYYLNVIVSMLQLIVKKNNKIIVKKDSTLNNKNNTDVCYTTYSIDTKEFYTQPISHDFNKDIIIQEKSTELYKLIQFWKFMIFSYNYFCYFFWLLLYLVFIIVLTYYFLFFYKTILTYSEYLLCLNFFFVFIPEQKKNDIVTLQMLFSQDNKN